MKEFVYNIRKWEYNYPKKSDDIDDRWLDERVDISFLFNEPNILEYIDKSYDFLYYLLGVDGQIVVAVDENMSVTYPDEYKIIKI